MKTTSENNGRPAPWGRFENSKRRGACGLLASLSLACAVVPAVAGSGDFAEPLADISPVAADDGWKMGLDVYGWAAGIGVETAAGQSVDVGFSDILDNLKMAAMTGFSAEKGRWKLGVDLIYLDMGGSSSANGAVPTKFEIDLKSWIVTPRVSYKVFDESWGTFSVFGGARYLYLKEESTLTIGVLRASSSSSGDSWAGIAGFEGVINLSERWFMPYYADIGVGDPDLTWQAFLGVGYHFDSWDLIAGYRYLKWEFESNSSLKEMDVSGPIIGASFKF